jgi:adenosylcobinamide-phosphate synthase
MADRPRRPPGPGRFAVRQVAVPVLLALLLDVLFGDPPNRAHPTVWMGGFITRLARVRPHGRPTAEFLFGTCLLLSGLLLCVAAGGAVTWLAGRLPSWPAMLVQALVLKSTFSARGLDRAAKAVEAALRAGDLPEARRLLSWHLVSRDTTRLDEARVSAATIESVAENASDGMVAPLLFHALGGLPLALAYRFANTADSMLGYRDPAREWLGKPAARLDDLLNLIPARLTGLLIVAAACLTGADGRGAWRILRRDAGRTASPNAGVPMSAMAGALGVELEKVGHYVLGAGLRAPGAEDVRRARRLFHVAAALAASSFALWGLLGARG